ncbi:MAG: MOSC domain-containing protein [Proteobacteria bacterium]|nr:MAG: MOSC domain-containing protein [Pseudomonadota bacterium]
MRLISIQVGQPKTVEFRRKPIRTGIFKEPVLGPVRVLKTHLEGDGQADLRVHGGETKAVYAYSLDAYEWWKMKRPGDRFSYGAFGENLCIDEILETETFVGDVFELGTALLQATQPREPCFKLGIKFDDQSIIKTFMESDRPGIYFRVLKEGVIEAGDELKLVERSRSNVSMYDLWLELK